MWYGFWLQSSRSPQKQCHAGEQKIIIISKPKPIKNSASHIFENSTRILERMLHVVQIKNSCPKQRNDF